VLFVNQLCTPLSNYHNLFHPGCTLHIVNTAHKSFFCSSEDGSCICVSIKNDRHRKFVHRRNLEQVKMLHLCDIKYTRGLYIKIFSTIISVVKRTSKGFCFTKIDYDVIQMVL